MIGIIAVGTLKEDYLKKAFEDYKTRISHYDRISITELPEGNSALSEEKILAIEGEKILSAAQPYDKLILLDRRGKSLTSCEFSKLINKLQLSGSPKLAFVIGSSCGVSDEVIAKADMSISFSSLTFPHALFRVMLAEQIYRAFKIIKNEKYHK